MTEKTNQPSKMTLWLVFACGVFLSILSNLPLLDSEFALGRAGEFGGRFQGAIQGVWHDHGFLAQQGRPTLWPIPTEPVSGRSYVHRPLFFHYMERVSVCLLGLNELSLRGNSKAIF